MLEVKWIGKFLHTAAINSSIKHDQKFLSLKLKSQLLKSTKSNSITNKFCGPSKSFREMQNCSEINLTKSKEKKNNPRLKIHLNCFLKCKYRGAWVAQSVKRLTSAQVMISQSVSSSPTLGSVLTTQSLEPVSDSVSPSLSAPPPLTLCLSKMNKCLKKFF